MATTSGTTKVATKSKRAEGKSGNQDNALEVGAKSERAE